MVSVGIKVTPYRKPWGKRAQAASAGGLIPGAPQPATWSSACSTPCPTRRRLGDYIERVNALENPLYTGAAQATPPTWADHEANLARRQTHDIG